MRSYEIIFFKVLNFGSSVIYINESDPSFSTYILLKISLKIYSDISSLISLVTFGTSLGIYSYETTH